MRQAWLQNPATAPTTFVGRSDWVKPPAADGQTSLLMQDRTMGRHNNQTLASIALISSTGTTPVRPYAKQMWTRGAALCFISASR
mmetsp:Transcript_11402/g.17191  ORF Transcript_11402/g.17191 Transcript_11402/m.17191 type:complete len:85 (-) Transcript_11402:327-581(-)